MQTITPITTTAQAELPLAAFQETEAFSLSFHFLVNTILFLKLCIFVHGYKGK